MGTLTKTKSPAKKPVKKPVKKAATPTAIAGDLNPTVTKVTEALAPLLTGLESGPFPQELLSLYKAMEAHKARIEGVMKRIETEAKAHKGRKGVFQDGRFEATFPVTSRVSPKWKDEAMRLAEELAAEKDEAFLAEAVENDIKSKYPATTSTGFKVVKVEE